MSKRRYTNMVALLPVIEGMLAAGMSHSEIEDSPEGERSPPMRSRPSGENYRRTVIRIAEFRGDSCQRPHLEDFFKISVNGPEFFFGESEAIHHACEAPSVDRRLGGSSAGFQIGIPHIRQNAHVRLMMERRRELVQRKLFRGSFVRAIRHCESVEAVIPAPCGGHEFFCHQHGVVDVAAFRANKAGPEIVPCDANEFFSFRMPGSSSE